MNEFNSNMDDVQQQQHQQQPAFTTMANLSPTFINSNGVKKGVGSNNSAVMSARTSSTVGETVSSSTAAFGYHTPLNHQQQLGMLYQPGHEQQQIQQQNQYFQVESPQPVSGGQMSATMTHAALHSQNQQNGPQSFSTSFSQSGHHGQDLASQHCSNIAHGMSQQQQQQPIGIFSQTPATAPAGVTSFSAENILDNNTPVTVGPVHDPNQMDMDMDMDQAFMEEFQKPTVVVDDPPPENPLAEDVDKITAVSLNELPMASREEVLYDLHGISNKVSVAVETPEFLQAKLQALDVAIQHTNGRSAYDMAASIDQHYVNNPAFRVRFLRAESYDVPRTAIRFVKHFQAKLELFDETLLCKDITQDDLERFHRKSSSGGDTTGTNITTTTPCPAIRSLYSGWIQEFPVRDVAGRLCSVVSNRMVDPNMHVNDLLRAVFYRRMVNSEDSATQEKGIVLITYKASQPVDRIMVWKVGRLLSSLPLRFMGYHMCFEAEEYNRISSVIALGRMAVNVFDRHRFRVHTGSTLEINYALQTFGIPITSMPVDANGYVSTDNDRNFWLNRRRAEQELASQQQAIATAQPPVSTIEVVPSNSNAMDDANSNHVINPGSNDVLLGRGKSFQDHAGNVRFRLLIEQHHHDYERAIKNEKTVVALRVLHQIHERGGRFLTASELGWVEVDEVSAREKIASCFRSFRKRQYPSRYKKPKASGS